MLCCRGATLALTIIRCMNTYDRLSCRRSRSDLPLTQPLRTGFRNSIRINHQVWLNICIAVACMRRAALWAAVAMELAQNTCRACMKFPQICPLDECSSALSDLIPGAFLKYRLSFGVNFSTEHDSWVAVSPNIFLLPWRARPRQISFPEDNRESFLCRFG